MVRKRPVTCRYLSRFYREIHSFLGIVGMPKKVDFGLLFYVVLFHNFPISPTHPCDEETNVSPHHHN